jgi:hypothetical protein
MGCGRFRFAALFYLMLASSGAIRGNSAVTGLLDPLLAERFSLLWAIFLIQFTLYSRSYCHLCEDMLQTLQALRGRHMFAIEVIDVDGDESLVSQYDELVPVLVARKGDADPVRLCHYFLDETKVEAFLLDDASR